MATLVCTMCKQKKDFRMNFLQEGKVYKTCNACRRRMRQTPKSAAKNRQDRMNAYYRNAPWIRLKRRAEDKALRRLKWAHPIEFGMYYEHAMAAFLREFPAMIEHLKTSEHASEKPAPAAKKRRAAS